MSKNKQSFTKRLAGYISNLKYDDLPDDVVKQAKKVILDALGCQVACASLDNGKSIIKFGESIGGKAEASVVGSDLKTSAVTAALVNGTLGHGDEIDESTGEAGHVAAVVVPAALACGEKQKASGKDMITAVVAGFDMAGGLANAGVSVLKLKLGYSDGFAAVFWSVAAASNILKLGADKTRMALGLAGCQSGGFYDFSETKHMAKSLMCGLGARNGVTAALLARIGFDGPLSVFDGESSILKYQAGDRYDSEELTRNLGKKFTIMDASIKLYSVGHPIHSPAHGLIKIIEREGIRPEEIRSITVRLPAREFEVVNNRNMPSINVQYCLAVAAFDHRLTWDQFTNERVKDPRVIDLKNRVTAMHDLEMDNLKKITGSHSSRVDVETEEGKSFSITEDYPPGDPNYPASQEDVETKVIYYASKVLGKDRGQNLIDKVNKLEAMPDLNELGEKLRLNANTA